MERTLTKVYFLSMRTSTITITLHFPFSMKDLHLFYRELMFESDNMNTTIRGARRTMATRTLFDDHLLHPPARVEGRSTRTREKECGHMLLLRIEGDA